MNRLNSKIKNIIFDMNGTMIFDGKYHEIAWKDYAIMRRSLLADR